MDEQGKEEKKVVSPTEIENFCNVNQIEYYVCNIKKRGGGRPRQIMDTADTTPTISDVVKLFGTGTYSWEFSWETKDGRTESRELTLCLDGMFYEDLHKDYKKNKVIEGQLFQPSQAQGNNIKETADVFVQAFSMAKELGGKKESGNDSNDMLKFMMQMQMENSKQIALAQTESNKNMTNMMMEQSKQSMQFMTLLIGMTNNKPQQGINEHDLMEKTFTWFERITQMKDMALPTPPAPETVADRIFGMVEKFFPILMTVVSIPKAMAQPIIEQAQEAIHSDPKMEEDFTKFNEDSVTRQDVYDRCILKYGEKNTIKILKTLGLEQEEEEEPKEEEAKSE